MTEADKRVTYVCEKCGSDRVTRDAWAEWDTGTQQWTIGAVYDYAFCHRCEEGTHLSEVSLKPSHVSSVA